MVVVNHLSAVVSHYVTQTHEAKMLNVMLELIGLQIQDQSALAREDTPEMPLWLAVEENVSRMTSVLLIRLVLTTNVKILVKDLTLHVVSMLTVR